MLYYSVIFWNNIVSGSAQCFRQAKYLDEFLVSFYRLIDPVLPVTHVFSDSFFFYFSLFPCGLDPLFRASKYRSIPTTCNWYQNVRLVRTRGLVPSVTFLSQSFKLTYLDHYVPTMLFVMTSGDLNIDLTQKCFFFYKTCRFFNELSNAVCRLSLRIMAFEICRGAERPPARF